ncbi:MAG: glycosyltransferase family 2 protein [Candidatus Hodarchaeota archaeon]
MTGNSFLKRKKDSSSEIITVSKEQEHSKLKKDENSLLISIIIPVFNEEFTIKDILERIPNLYQQEIIVIDDGSIDKSIEQIKEVKNKNVHIVKHPYNLGYGAAIQTGIKHASGDILITMDSDGQHNPEEITKLIKPIINNDADIVVGSRYKGNSIYKVPLHTRVGEFIINNCLKFFFHQKVGNNQSGFRAFSKRSLKIFKNMIYSTFTFCTEILFKAAYYNLRIIEIPITVNPRKFGVSYVILLKMVTSIAFCLIIYALKKFKIKKIIPKRIADMAYYILLKYLRNLY